MQCKCFTPSQGTLPTMADTQRIISQLKALPPAVEPPRHRKSASWTSSQTHPRTTLIKAIQDDEFDEMTFVLDTWEQITTHTVGKKLRAYMEQQVRNLEFEWVCIALSMANATRKKMEGGLVKRFKNIGKYEIPRIKAEREERLLKAMEADGRYC